MPDLDKTTEFKRRTAELREASRVSHEEVQRRVEAAVEMEKQDKPLKPARSKAEITRVRQGWTLIGLALIQITLVWVTRG